MTTTRIKIDHKLFNPLYWHILSALDDNNIRFIYVKGGSSAAKTYSITQALCMHSLRNQYNAMVMRKVSADLKDTVFNDFKEVTTKFNEDIKLYDVQLNNIKVLNSNIRFRGLDKPEKIKGLSTYKKIYINEITALNFGDWKELKRRLRGRVGQQIISDWNPIDRNHWLKTKVIDKEKWTKLSGDIKGQTFSQLDPEYSSVMINEEKDSLYITTTYRDNYWIVGHPIYQDVGMVDTHTLNTFEKMKRDEPDDYSVYGLGNWGVISERLIFTKWQTVSEIPKEAKRIPRGMDFGMSPDPTVLVDLFTMQKGDDHYLFIDELLYETNLLTLSLGDGNDNDSMEDRFKQIGVDKTDLLIADSAGKREIRALRKSGYNIWGAKKGADSIRYGIRIMKNYYICLTERSINIINEFQNYKKKVDHYGNILPEPIDEYNHGIDATRYVLINKGRLW